MRRNILAGICRRGSLNSTNFNSADGIVSESGFALPNGFTLMELLIVIAIILILMLMAIPTIGSLKKKANETSAINSMQVITKAEVQYSSTYGANGFACTLPALGGDTKSGAPSPTSAQILQPDLAAGDKSGYLFSISCKDKITANGVDRYNSYVVTDLAKKGAIFVNEPCRKRLARPAIAASAATSSAPLPPIRPAAPVAASPYSEPDFPFPIRRPAFGLRAFLCLPPCTAKYAGCKGLRAGTGCETVGCQSRPALQPAAIPSSRV